MSGMYPELRAIVRGTYDLQKVRIQLGNRAVTNFKVKLGQAPSSSEESLDEDSKKILALLRSGPAKITDALVAQHNRTETGIEEEESPEQEDAPLSVKQEKKIGKLISELIVHRYSVVTKDQDGKKSFPKKEKFKGDPVISSYTELALFGEYIDMLKAEKNHFTRLGEILKDYTIYTDYLAQIAGIGPAMAGVLLSELDIRDKPARDQATGEILKDPVTGETVMKPLRPSSFVKYAGLDCGPDGKGRSKRPEHLVDRTYKDKDGVTKTKKGITFNDFLKTKLIGVLGPCMLRSGNEKYGKIYRDYKHRLENHELYGTRNDGKKETGADGQESKKYITCKARRHAMATRYMVVFFLRDLYTAWRKLEGLPVALPYAEAKLGLKHRPD